MRGVGSTSGTGSSSPSCISRVALPSYPGRMLSPGEALGLASRRTFVVLATMDAHEVVAVRAGDAASIMLTDAGPSAVPAPAAYSLVLGPLARGRFARKFSHNLGAISAPNARRKLGAIWGSVARR